MKFQLFIFYLISIVDCGDPKKLSPDENEKRLKKCGRDEIPADGNSVVSSATINNKEYTTATYISSRHILTSAEIILSNDDKKIIGKDEVFDDGSCKEKWISVPQDFLRDFRLGFETDSNVSGAYILCTSYINGHSSSLSYPMILETDTDVEVPYPCMPDDRTAFTTFFKFYKYNSDDKAVKSDEIKYHYCEETIYTWVGTQENGTGGALLTKDKPYVLIGLGGTRSGNTLDFYDLRRFHMDICDKFGICQRTGKLATEENRLRKENCGERNDTVIGAVRNGGKRMTATLISSRHVLTSAEVLTKNFHDTQGKTFCSNLTNSHFTVLPGQLEGVRIELKNGVVKYSKKAYIICNKETSERASELSYPMLIELEENVDIQSTPCLPDRNLNFREEVLDEGKLFHVFHALKQKLTTGDGIHATRNGTYLYTKWYDNNERGVALIEEVETLWKLVGVGARDVDSENKHSPKCFFDIQWILEDLCELAGICQPEAAPPPVATKTPSPKPPGSDNSTISKTPEPPEPMEPIKTIDLDQEYKEFMERQEKESVILDDDDEWGNDFYRSADFFESSGRRTELFVGFLMVIMVVWRMVMG